ncbi:unnamed protein product [Nippostrongylus brasiliensis]|uniref:HORMA domain-containing protein n=1 Tax=Nippostrongylus brasiliensis TaxID=27835 RepID=A0A0N4YM93_NIPBR|nr:unnamed protein product [Nippostrongylus brasiliensis]
MISSDHYDTFVAKHFSKTFEHKFLAYSARIVLEGIQINAEFIREAFKRVIGASLSKIYRGITHSCTSSSQATEALARPPCIKEDLLEERPQNGIVVPTRIEIYNVRLRAPGADVTGDLLTALVDWLVTGASRIEISKSYIFPVSDNKGLSSITTFGESFDCKDRNDGKSMKRKLTLRRTDNAGPEMLYNSTEV